MAFSEGASGHATRSLRMGPRAPYAASARIDVQIPRVPTAASAHRVFAAMSLSRDFVHRTAAVAAILTAFVLVGLLVVQATGMLVLLFAGVLLAVMLRGVAGRIVKHTPMPVALALVGIAIIAALVGRGWFVGPKLASQADVLRERIPQALHGLEARLEALPLVQHLLQNAPPVSRIITSRTGLFSKITGVVSIVFDLGTETFFVVALGAYLAARPGIYTRGFAGLFAPAYRRRIRDLLQELGTTLGWWLAGKAISMSLIGVLNGIGLWLLGVPVPVALALITALFTFIPNFGPILSLVPASLVALTVSPMLAVYVVALHFSIQFVETYLVTPLVQQRMVALPPGLTLTVQLLSGLLFVTLGLILAAPLAAAGIVVVHRLVPWETPPDAGFHNPQ